MTQIAEMERMAAQVRRCARDSNLIETAQVRLVGIDAVREAAGPRWPRMREHVRERSFKIIASRIGPEDAVVACGDGFLVVFADTTAQASQRQCAEIQEALLSFYLGEEALQPLRADVRHESVSAASLVGMVASEAALVRLQYKRADLQVGRFWPLWSTRRQCVAAHLCAPVVEILGLRRMGYAPDFLETGAHCERDYLDLDLCLLEQACAAAAAPEIAPIGVTVHATTMQNRKSRTIYLSHAGANALPMKQRMFVTIAEIEPGTPLISLTEWCSGLKHPFQRVTFDLHHSDRAIGGLASAGAWAAGYHLPGMQRSCNAGLRIALNDLNAWCHSVRRQGLQPMVHGFANWGFLDLSSYTHLAFASGEGLWPSQIKPALPPANAASAQAARPRP